MANKRLAETIMIYIVVWMFWLLYVPVGSFTASEGVNYATMLVSPLDRLISCHAFLYLPYLFEFMFVPIASITVVITNYHTPAVEQKLVFTFLIVIGLSYLIYLLFPANVPMVKKIPSCVYESGLLNQIILESQKWITPWNSFPAMHISTAWIPFRFFYWKLRYSVPYFIWFVFMCWGAMASGYHSIADIIMGILLVEAVFFFYNKYEAWFTSLFRPSWYRARMIFWNVAIVVLGIIIYVSAVKGLFLIKS